MELSRHLDQYWQTIRFLRGAQIASRLDLRARAAVRSLAPPVARRLYARSAARSALVFPLDPWGLRGSADAAVMVMPQTAVEAAAREAADASAGTFTFLNDARRLGRPVDWQAAEASQLWRYHLHYFDVLPDLIVGGAAPVGFDLMTDWIDRVQLAAPDARDAWHPYVVSVRIVNWMIFLATAPAGIEPAPAIVESLRLQTIFVRRNLETDVGGNHLLKNLKALVMAGCFWHGDGAMRLRQRFTTAFTRALAGQLRSDGGHYEQSPMYHVQVLGDAVEVAMALRHAREDAHDLEALIDRMTDHLAQVCHPDGQLAQFGDTAAGMTPEPAALAATASVLHGVHPGRRLASRHALLASGLSAGVASARPAAAAKAATPPTQPSEWDSASTGFIKLETRDERGFLIADAGPVCPDDLPAHAHSDLFGFEVSVDRARMVVDSGVSEYAAGEWRDYFRSTRAHNTVMVDGAEQSECWGSFRVARRAAVVGGRVEPDRIAPGFSAAHSGFDRLTQPVRHRRHFRLLGGRHWLIVDDLSGEGSHRWSTFLHLHPSVEVVDASGARAIARRDGATLGISWFGIAAPQCVAGARDPLQGWYAPAFGLVFPAPTLVAAGAGPLPVRFGWLLVPHAQPSDEFAVRADGGRVSVDAAGERFDLAIGAEDPAAR